MDLKTYYRSIRELEDSIQTECVVIVSQETPDGGKPGVETEVVRSSAARLVVEGKARLATREEEKSYRAAQEEKRLAAEEQAARSRIQVTLVSEADLREVKGGNKGSRQ